MVMLSHRFKIHTLIKSVYNLLFYSQTLAGKLVAILCALSGILAFALPVPGIICRFQEEQEHAANHRIINSEDSTPVRNELRKIFAKPMAH